MFESEVLRKMFRHKKGEVSGQFGMLRNAKLCGLYKSHSFVRILEFRRLHWTAGKVTGMEGQGMCIEFLWENLLVNSYMEDQEGEGGGFAWSPLLPDLNPCDFSVGYLKDLGEICSVSEDIFHAVFWNCRVYF